MDYALYTAADEDIEEDYQKVKEIKGGKGMSTLYELTGEYLALSDMLLDDEVDEQTVLDTLEGVKGEIEIMIDSPWESRGGVKLGSMALTAEMEQVPSEYAVPLDPLSTYTGKHAIFFVFKSNTKGKSICKLKDFVFQTK
jgi:hypothetical protein